MDDALRIPGIGEGSGSNVSVRASSFFFVFLLVIVMDARRIARASNRRGRRRRAVRLSQRMVKISKTGFLCMVGFVNGCWSEPRISSDPPPPAVDEFSFQEK